MKVLLVEPFINYPVASSQVGINIGLLSLASYVNKNLPNEVSFEFFSQQLEVALGRKKDIEQVLKKTSPDVVAINCISSNFTSALAVANIAKKAGCFVMLGGIFPTLNASSIIKEEDNIDLIVRGEGEQTFLKIMKSFRSEVNLVSLSHIHGLTFKRNGQIHNTSDAKLLSPQEISMPDYSLVRINEYKRLNAPASLETARGCYFNCKFCSLRDFWQHCCRMKPIQNVLDELYELKYRFGFKNIMFIDDTFTLDRKRVLSLCDRIIEEKLEMQYSVLTRIDMVDALILNRMHEAGVRKILFGVEHINPEILLSMGKVTSLAETSKWKNVASKNIQLASDIGFEVNPVYVLGWPHENNTTLQELADFIISNMRKNVIPYLSFVTPHPGTRLWKEAPNLGLKIVERDLNKYTHLYPVSVPLSLGPDAQQKLISAYNSIVRKTSSEDQNPII